MGPKAEKKPAEKKLAEEKKVVVTEKPREKKPKAGKKLPKESGAGAADKKKKKRSKKNVETYKIYIFKLLKQLASESSKLARYNKKPTITSREIQTAVRLVFPGELASMLSRKGRRLLPNLLVLRFGGLWLTHYKISSFSMN
ncbi:unnamed protein product [Lactuca saligna]|uniref:Histone H2B n=1 Tax=Lactuca saligna TaxID=75948 RepID=A0AA35Y5Y9_LACSI|nr:unnamed protein product [Lactuca saligna]